jgi:hypothetical protein
MTAMVRLKRVCHWPESMEDNIVAKRVKQSTPSVPLPAIDTDTRQQEIALSAYYRAEARGFAPGSELEDWLEAEREVTAHGAEQ